jgi:hypothetical protein
MKYPEEDIDDKEVILYRHLSKPLKAIVILGWIVVVLLTVSVTLNLFA